MFTKSKSTSNTIANMQYTLIFKPISLHADDDSFVDTFILVTAAKAIFMADIIERCLNENGFKVAEFDRKFEDVELVSILYHKNQDKFSQYRIDGIWNFHRLDRLYDILSSYGCVIYFEDYDNENKFKPKTSFNELKKCVIHSIYLREERAQEKKACICQ